MIHPGYLLLVLLMLGALGVACTSQPTPAVTAAPQPAVTSTPKPPAVEKATPERTVTSTPKPQVTVAASQPTPDRKDWPRTISITTPPLGTGAHGVMVAISSLITKYLNINATVEGTAGNLAAITVLAKKESEFANSSSEANWDAYRGTGAFAPLGRTPLRLVAGSHAVFVHLATRQDSGIKTFQDIKGKRLMYLLPGASLLQMSTEALLEAYDMKPDDVKALKSAGLNDSVKALIENRTDVIAYPSGAKGSAFIELSTTIPTFYIPVDEAHIAKAAKKYSFLSGQLMPANTYKGQDKDTLTIGVATGLITRDDIPETLVYAVTKTLWDHADEFRVMHPAAAEWAIGKVLLERTMPWHPGAIRYYQEKGLWTGEMDTLQKQFLAQ